MFKKERDLTERSRTLLKNKEVRTLKQDILTAFPSLTEEALNALLPNKADVQCVKLANRTILYSVGEKVLFFDLQGRKDLYPSLHALWQCPSMLRTLYTHGPVSRFVLRGADFMIPGLASVSDLAGLREGEKVSLSIRGNPQPFAVGESNVGYPSLLDSAGRKQKGKAVTVLHSFGDLLASSRCAPNDGFSAEEIFATEKCEDDSDDEDDEEEEEEEEEGIVKEEEFPPLQQGEEGEEGAEEVEQQMQKLDLAGEDTAMTASASVAAEEEEEELEEGEESTAKDEREKRDIQLMEALVLAFKHIIKEKQLPMLVSTFWAILHKCHQCAPSFDETSLDIKKTSFRKVSKFLQHCQRIDLLTYRDDHGIATITAVKRAHDIFREFKVEDAEAFREAMQKLKEPTSFASEKSVPGKLSAGSKITVLELYKMPRNFRDIFGNVRGEHGEHLKSSEIRDMLMMYIKSHNLEIPDRRSSLHIEPTDPVHPLVRSAVKTASPDADTTVAAPPVPPKEIEEEEEPYDPSAGYSASVAGVLTSDPWTSAPAITMKIAKDGLKNIDDVDFPSLSASASASAASSQPKPANMASRIKGSSSVGGWGVDAGKQWKPISLPPAPQKKVVGAPPSTGNKKDSAHHSSAKQKKDKTPTADAALNAIELSKEEFMKAIVSKMTTYHAVLQPSGEINVHSGKVPRVKIIVEMRMGNKTVTLLRGIAEYDIDLGALAKACQKKFACSVSVSTVPGIASEKEIVLQGNYATEMENFLIDCYGIPRHVFDITAGKGVKMKKK